MVCTPPKKLCLEVWQSLIKLVVWWCRPVRSWSTVSRKGKKMLRYDFLEEVLDAVLSVIDQNWIFWFLSQVLTILYLLHRLMFLMHLSIFFDKLGMSLKALEDLVIHPGLCFHVLYAPPVATWSVFESWAYFSRHYRLSQWVTACMKNEGFLGCKAYVSETGQEILISILKWVFFLWTCAAHYTYCNRRCPRLSSH
jgi:hypothetical protein